MSAREHDEIRLRLDDYAEDTLSAADAQRVRAHLAACAECAAEASFLASLLREARGLPAELEPSRDLWPSIRGALPGTVPVAAPTRPRTSRLAWLLPRLAPIAAALAVAAFLWTRAERGGERLAPVPHGAEYRSPAASTELVAVIAAMEMECRGTVVQLRAAFRERPESANVAAAAAIARNVTVLDRAIAETRAALAEDPGDRELLAILAQRTHRKLSLLQEAVQRAALA